MERLKIAKQLVKIAKELVSFFGKADYSLKKKDLQNPGKYDIRKQKGGQDLPVSVYIWYPDGHHTNDCYWVFYITDKMTYAQVKVFRTQSQAKRFTESIFDKYKAMQERKERRKQERKQTRLNFKHSYKVGDVIVCSWGYDQTNINFFLVKEVGEKSIKIVQVGKKVVRTDSVGDQEVVPETRREIGKPMTKIVQPGDQVKIFSFAYGQKWSGKPVEQTGPYNRR